ncbi:GntG family PLP-dependent aldolase [Candidatus Kapabacteria bacterium]|nr:GntG family PLP-dependent aldolase [Candidatus Kapabacteria bacterium]
MIDLRSDTVTKPSEKMRETVVDAIVGDDVYSEDSTVNNLQNMIADYFGMEAALFMPSGTMANQTALNILTNQGDEIIVEQDSHIFYYETAGPSILSGLQLRTIASEKGEMDLNTIKECIRPNVYYFPKTSLICLENTHNRHGGTVISLDYMEQVKELANQYKLKTHLDGARLWNAIVKHNLDPKAIGKCFDTISVCFSKGLGAPIGSCLVGSNEYIRNALKVRKIYGGGMRQVGIIANPAIYALENNLDLLKYDHENAKYFSENISNFSGIILDPNDVETNIVTFKLEKPIDADTFVTNAKNMGMLLMHIGNNKIRTVFHLDISSVMTSSAVDIIKTLLTNK